jgi:hypothetical protein
MQQSEKVGVMPVAFIADELKKLWDLKQAGALTEGEYAQQKARLLGEQTTTEVNPEQPTSRPARSSLQLRPARSSLH